MRATSLIPTLLALAATAAGAQCNQPPIAVDDKIVSHAGTFWIDVTANDSELDGESVSVTLLNNLCVVTPTVEMNAIRFATSEPMPNCSLTYRLTDESGNHSLAATVTIEIDGLFDDGFETGATDRWSSSCSSC